MSNKRSRRATVCNQRIWVILYELHDTTAPAKRNIVLLFEDADKKISILAIRTGIKHSLDAALVMFSNALKKTHLSNSRILVISNISAFVNSCGYLPFPIFNATKANKKKLMRILKERKITLQSRYLGYDPDIYELGGNVLRTAFVGGNDTDLEIELEPLEY